ncbi:MAG: response regulator [Blastocatellia bacterium]|nr:response regulator [Blastocatellia bacterium]
MKRILVVDDEEDIRELLRDILTDSGYDVVTAEDGLKAVSEVKQSIPDLVILDVMMPIISGPRLMLLLQSYSEPISKIPIIICSASHVVDEVLKSEEFDVQPEDCISKPFQVRELLRKVNERLRDKK